MLKRAGRRWLALGTAAALLVAADQVVLRTALRDGYFLARRVAPYDPPLFSEPQRETLERLERVLAGDEGDRELLAHDAELGWAPKKNERFNEGHHDWSGARIGDAPLAREKRAGVRRVVTVGCSFTYGAEVEDGETWAAVLDALRDDVEVANLGVGGYGIDQALMRYLRDGRPLAPDEVWLGLMPSAAQRVLTVYRPAETHWGRIVYFKPRYELDGADGLALVPNPAPTLERMHELLTDQRAFFDAVAPHDTFVRRWPSAYAPEGTRLVHYTALGRLVLSALEYRERDALAELADSTSETHRLCSAIVRRLRDETRNDGARFRLLVLPCALDVVDQRSHARPSWAGLVDELERDGIEVVDVTPDLPGPGDPRWNELYLPGSHWTPLGNRLVAERLARLFDPAR